MKQILFYIALTGWFLGLTVHLLSVADYDLTQNFPFIWILHPGIFIVWFPAIILIIRNEELINLKRPENKSKVNPFKVYRIIFKNAPIWFKIVVFASFFYGIANFLLFMSSQPGGPAIENGQYILQNHGTLIRVLTEQEYHHFKANEVRGFSGHWLVFYGVAAAIFFPKTNK